MERRAHTGRRAGLAAMIAGLALSVVILPGGADAVPGLLASLAIFASLVGLAYRPARLIPGALFLALLAVAMSPRHQRLAAFAVGIGAACFMIGMAAAVVTDHPLF